MAGHGHGQGSRALPGGYRKALVEEKLSLQDEDGGVVVLNCYPIEMEVIHGKKLAQHGNSNETI